MQRLSGPLLIILAYAMFVALTWTVERFNIAPDIALACITGAHVLLVLGFYRLVVSPPGVRRP